MAEALASLHHTPGRWAELASGATAKARTFASSVWTRRFVEICREESGR